MRCGPVVGLFLNHDDSVTCSMCRSVRTRLAASSAQRCIRVASRFILTLRDPAGHLRCLPNPARHEFLVELVVLMDVKVAHFLVLGLAGEERTQSRASE